MLSQEFERECETLDSSIASVLRDIREAEVQQQQAFRSHMRSIDRLIDIQDARLMALEDDFRREVNIIEDEFAVERAGLIARHNQFRSELLHLAKIIREEEESKQAADQAEHEQQKESVRRRNLEKIHVLQTEMDAQIENMERAFEEAHLAYMASTDRRSTDFKALTERGQHDTLMNERQKRALKRLNKLLQLWRSKMANNNRECEERNEALEEERDIIAKQLEQLKIEISNNRTAHNNRMKSIATAALRVKASLAKNMTLAQRILVLAESVRSYQSPSEMVAPFLTGPENTTLSLDTGIATLANVREEVHTYEREQLTTTLSQLQANATESNILAVTNDASALQSTSILDSQNLPELPQFIVTAGLQSPSETLAAALNIPIEDIAPGTEDVLQEVDSLKNFHAMYNKALLETIALEKRRNLLKTEQAELQRALQQVLDGLSVTSTTVDGPNSLLVINNRIAGGNAALPPLGNTQFGAASLSVRGGTIRNETALSQHLSLQKSIASAGANRLGRVGEGAATGGLPVRMKPQDVNRKTATVVIEANRTANAYNVRARN